MSFDLSALTVEKHDVKDPCSGLFFRCKINDFWNERTKSIEYKTSYRLLKRRSCKGCSLCEWFYECRSMVGSDDVMDIVPPKQPENDAIYQLLYVPGSPDWESGYVEDWEWVLTKVGDNDGNL